MASGGLGRTQLPLQLRQAGIARCIGLAPTLQPLTVGIVDPCAEAQSPLKGPAGGCIQGARRQPLIKQCRHKPPGLNGRRLLQGPLDQGLPLPAG